MKKELLAIGCGAVLLVTVAAKRTGYFGPASAVESPVTTGFVKIEGSSIDGSEDLMKTGYASGNAAATATTGRQPEVPLKDRLAAQDEGEPLHVTWEDIAWFEYETPDPLEEDPEVLKTLKDQIPESVKELDGQLVTIEGYMNPLKLEEGRVRTFYLYRHFQNCCFGAASRLIDVIKVEVTSKDGAEFLPYAVVMVTGTLEVGETYDDYGYVSNVFRMKSSSVIEKW